MNGSSEFTQGEIKGIISALSLADQDILAIFFGQEVS
jgi:hypothetical protein